MMFRNLFKAKWQHKDANVRILAIQRFDIKDNANVIILNSLINDDESELVRRTALLKLGQFSTYLKQANENSLSKIRMFANEQIQQLVLSNNVSKSDKKNLLEKSDRVAFIEQWLQVEHDVDLLKLLLAKINKPHSLSQFIIRSDNTALQEEVLSRLNEIPLLEKIAKKLSQGSIKTLVQDKIDRLKSVAEKPEKNLKLSQLLLSKLLALKELQDFSDMSKRRIDIEEQWQQKIITEIDCLPLADQQMLRDKYLNINQQLKTHFAVHEEAFQHQQIINKKNAQKQQQRDDYKEAISNISLQISDAVFENIKLDEIKVNGELDRLINDLKQSLLTTSEQLSFKRQIEQLHDKLNKLPEVAECVSKATSLISKLSTLALPSTVTELNLRKPIFDDWLQQWKNINSLANDILPQSIIKARDELEQQWQRALAPLNKQQHGQFQLVSRKVSELKRLINQGKYKSAFGLHKKLTFLMSDLSVEQQQRLATDFNHVSDQIKELHELEAFVVTPRKKDMLQQVKNFVEQPLDNPSEQATKVKAFRKHWNSLGHADEDLDKELNLEFNLLCEQAFAPCREFYAQQSKIRARHLTEKLSILDHFASLNNELNSNDVDWRSIDNQFHSLLADWRKSGEIDRSEYQKLQPKLKQLVDPIKSAINTFHQNNAQQKQDIIEKAKLQLNNDDVFNAIEQLKAMQQQWRIIGHAGAHKENTLWQNFRKINDQVFAKRNLVKEQQKSLITEQYQAFNARLFDIENNISNAQQNDLKDVATNLEHLIVDIKSLKPVAKELISKVTALKIKLEEKISSATKDKEKLIFANLFSLIECSMTQTLAEIKENQLFLDLPKPWQKCIVEAYREKPINTDITRQELTLELEILAKVESPKAYAARRLQIQMAMLSEKMMQGEGTDLNLKLQQWICVGVLQPNETELLQRIKPIFA